LKLANLLKQSATFPAHALDGTLPLDVLADRLLEEPQLVAHYVEAPGHMAIRHIPGVFGPPRSEYACNGLPQLVPWP
jgi:hypothetical protein